MPKPIEPTEAEQRKEALLRAVARAYGATHRAAPRAALIGGDRTANRPRAAEAVKRPRLGPPYQRRRSGQNRNTGNPRSDGLQGGGDNAGRENSDSDERRNPKGRMAQPARRNDLDQRR